MLHLVSLVKRRDVDRVSDDSDPGCTRLGGPTCEGPPGAGLPAPDGPDGLDGDLSDAGMSTVEYAVGTVAAAAFAAVLYQIVTGGSVLAGLTDLINRAMSLF